MGKTHELGHPNVRKLAYKHMVPWLFTQMKLTCIHTYG